jgi:RNA polymerase sigma-70 factor (ECF subfamily)
MSPPLPAPAPTRDEINRFFGEIRPKLHRYCARMTGSVVDGEDVVQEALMKAMAALAETDEIIRLENWLFRIAHNTALDFLRRRARQAALHTDEDPEMIVDPTAGADRRQIAAASLGTFMRLPVAQRSTVVLKDVLGYSLNEIAGFLELSLPAVKAALHRGRERLRMLADEPDDMPVPALAEPERSLLAAYIDRFNARDFDAVRDMLADEARLDLVNRRPLAHRPEIDKYFGNYAHIDDWHLVLGFVDGRPAALVRDRDEPEGPPIYFMLLEWADGKLVAIRDFRYARYIVEGARITMPG